MQHESSPIHEPVRMIIADHGSRWFSKLAPARGTSQSVVITRLSDEPPNLFVKRVLKRLLGLTIRRVVDVAYFDGSRETSCRTAVLAALNTVHGIRLPAAAPAAPIETGRIWNASQL